jgi:hypothetical protein
MRVMLAGMAGLVCGACSAAVPSKAAEATPREALAMFEGRWTLKGREDTFLEECGFYEGAHHMLCRSTSQGKKGVSKGISILTHSPTQGYLYFGIGSSGRAESLRGSHDAGTWTWRGEFTMDGKPVHSRVTIVPAAGGFRFKEELSRDGGPWTVEFEADYIRKR